MKTSEHTTPNMLLMDEFYRTSGVDRWDASRYQALCARLKITAYELGTLCGLATGRVTQILSGADAIPRSIGIHLQFLESWILWRNHGTPGMPAMPVHLLR